MEADKLVAALERFFLDIIGVLIPGAFLLIGIWAVLQPIHSGDIQVTVPKTAAGWWLLIAAGYVAGHAIATIGDRIVIPVATTLVRPLRWARHLGPVKSLLAKMGQSRAPVILSRKEMLESLAKRRSAKELPGLVQSGATLLPHEYHDWRNVAMTRITAQDRATVVRLMHLAMLNLGVATSIWIIGILLSYQKVWAVNRLASRQLLADLWLIVLVLGVTFLVSLPFLLRHFEFYDRTMRVPFDMAYAVVTDASHSAAKQEGSRGVAPSKQLGAGPASVYLSGGHRSGWQAQVINTVPGFVYRNPAAHNIADSAAYTAWDLEGIRSSDVVFAYLEANNPSGIGLALETGYAAALGKHVILVDEKTAQGDPLSRYLGIVRHTATVRFDTFDEGREYLRKLVLLAPRHAPQG